MSSRRHLLIAGIVWVVLSVVSMVLMAGIEILPVIASKEARIEDDAFVLLTVLSMPVLMFVVVGFVYSAISFRARDDDPSDGPPVHGNAWFQGTWLAVSFVLVIGLFTYGTIGLVDIRGAQTADFEVLVHAKQWQWQFEYPGTGVISDELHVPVDQRVHFLIDSKDAIHSFWVPAFGVKQDAVPGRPTQAYATPTVEGTYPAMCTELCGFGHTIMTATVIVSDEAAVTDWIAQQPGPPQ